MNLISLKDNFYTSYAGSIYFETPASFPKQAINALKTMEDYTLDIWWKFKKPIADVIKSVSKAKGAEIDI